MPATTLVRRPEVREFKVPQFWHGKVNAIGREFWFKVEHRRLGPNRVDIRVYPTLPGKEERSVGGVVGGPVFHLALAKAYESIKKLGESKHPDVEANRAELNKIGNALLLKLGEAHQRHGLTIEKGIVQNLRPEMASRVLGYLHERKKVA